MHPKQVTIKQIMVPHRDQQHCCVTVANTELPTLVLCENIPDQIPD